MIGDVGLAVRGVEHHRGMDGGEEVARTAHFFQPESSLVQGRAAADGGAL